MERCKQREQRHQIEDESKKSKFGRVTGPALWSAPFSHQGSTPFSITDECLNRALIQSIHDTLAESFNQKIAIAFFDHLEKNYSIKRAEIPYNLETLLTALKTPFGSRYAQTTGRAIAKRLYSSFTLDFLDHPDKSLVDYIESVRLLQEKACFNTQV